MPKIGPWLIAVGVAFSFLPNPYVVHVAVLVAIYVTLGMGLSIVVGLSGMLDLGYVAFYAVGAYGYALLNVHAGVGFWPALLICWVPAAGIGVLLGFPALRVRGDYLALVTLGLGEIVRLILLNWGPVTNGPQGIMGISGPLLFGHRVATPREYLWVGLSIAAVVTTITYRIQFSRAGLMMVAVRDHQAAAAAAGLIPYRWRLFAFAAGAAIAATAGVFFAGWQQFVSPTSFNLLESVLVLSIVVLAGYGRLFGIILASGFFVILPELLRQFAAARLLVYGLLLIAVVILQERFRLRRQEQRWRHGSLRVPLPVARELGTSQVRSTPVSRDSGKVMLSVSGLRKRFGGVVALDGVDLAIREGELIGLIGPNGAGKTTLFGCMAGAIVPDAGTVVLSSSDRVVAVPATPWLACRAGIGRTFQDGGVFESLSVLENVMIAIPDEMAGIVTRSILGARQRERTRLETTAREILRLVDVTDVDGAAGEMPLSVQKRITIARAIAAHPVLLLLDEPAAGMPMEERLRFMGQIGRIHETLGITVVIIEHDPAFILGLATRLVALDKGKVVRDGDPTDVARDLIFQGNLLPPASVT